MNRNIVSAFLASALLLAPSYVLAQGNSQGKGGEQGQAKRNDKGDLIFNNRGACESTLKQLRNAGRKATGTGGTLNQLNPVLNIACDVATDPATGQTIFVITKAIQDQVTQLLAS